MLVPKFLDLLRSGLLDRFDIVVLVLLDLLFHRLDQLLPHHILVFLHDFLCLRSLWQHALHLEPLRDPDLFSSFGYIQHLGLKILKFLHQPKKHRFMQTQEVTIAHCCVGLCGHLAFQDVVFAKHGTLDEVVRCQLMERLDLDTAIQQKIHFERLAALCQQHSARLDPHWREQHQVLTIENLVFVLKNLHAVNRLLIDKVHRLRAQLNR